MLVSGCVYAWQTGLLIRRVFDDGLAHTQWTDLAPAVLAIVGQLYDNFMTGW